MLYNKKVFQQQNVDLPYNPKLKFLSCEVKNMEYIEKLDRLRVSKKLSFRELGLLCELSESAVKKILYKESRPLMPSLEKICVALGITLPELFCEDDEIVITKNSETIALIAACDSLSSKSKKHLLVFLKSLCEK
jgi:transcriptional regulator with XRE-family HTH domain